MSEVAALSAISGEAVVQATSSLDGINSSIGDTATAPAFGDLVQSGLAEVENKVDAANDMVRKFAVDDSVPIHEVTMALGQARLSVELALQVRDRLVEGYREIMNMQL